MFLHATITKHGKCCSKLRALCEILWGRHAKEVFGDKDQTDKMLKDLRIIDFHAIKAQAKLVCRDCPMSAKRAEIPGEMDVTEGKGKGAAAAMPDTIDDIKAGFELALEKQYDLQKWAEWLQQIFKDHLERSITPGMKEEQIKAAIQPAGRKFLTRWCYFSSGVIRDLTLRSAKSFGSFHLIRLLYDEYIVYLVEQISEKGIVVLNHTPAGCQQYMQRRARQLAQAATRQGYAKQPAKPTYVQKVPSHPTYQQPTPPPVLHSALDPLAGPKLTQIPLTSMASSVGSTAMDTQGDKLYGALSQYAPSSSAPVSTGLPLNTGSVSVSVASYQPTQMKMPHQTTAMPPHLLNTATTPKPGPLPATTYTPGVATPTYPAATSLATTYAPISTAGTYIPPTSTTYPVSTGAYVPPVSTAGSTFVPTPYVPPVGTAGATAATSTFVPTPYIPPVGTAAGSTFVPTPYIIPPVGTAGSYVPPVAGATYVPPVSTTGSTFVPTPYVPTPYVPSVSATGATYIPPVSGTSATYVPPMGTTGVTSTYVPPASTATSTFVPTPYVPGATYVPPVNAATATYVPPVGTAAATYVAPAATTIVPALAAATVPAAVVAATVVPTTTTLPTTTLPATTTPAATVPAATTAAVPATATPAVATIN